jgi:Fungal N-terminal domain of STAND proteins
MDPLSITAGVASLVGTCVKTVRSLKAAVDTYKLASLTISAITSECSVISATLSQIQDLFLQNPDTLASKLGSQSQLHAAFETTLTGCSVTLAALDDELQKLTEGQGATGESSRRARLKYVWNENTMKELLQHLHGHHGGINLLLTALQM